MPPSLLKLLLWLSTAYNGITKRKPLSTPRASAYRLAFLTCNPTVLAAPGCVIPGKWPQLRATAWREALPGPPGSGPRMIDWCPDAEAGRHLLSLFCLPRAAEELPGEPTQSSVQPRPRSVALFFLLFLSEELPYKPSACNFPFRTCFQGRPLRTSRAGVWFYQSTSGPRPWSQKTCLRPSPVTLLSVFFLSTLRVFYFCSYVHCSEAWEVFIQLPHLGVIS